jgi:ABC-type microcin C transport system duplicated ATPase subunit YejF
MRLRSEMIVFQDPGSLSPRMTVQTVAEAVRA